MSPGEVCFGARGVPESAAYRGAVTDLVERTRRAVARDDSEVAHNAYVVYTAMMLMAASGHRPVADPFCWRQDIDTRFRVSLINDKVSTEAHANRLAWLSTSACEQVVAYDRHLSGLAGRLGRLQQPAAALARVVRAIAEGEPSSTPYLFLLDGNRTLSLNESRMSEILGDSWRWALNAGRHLLASDLRASGAQPAHIEAHLLHLDGFGHPFGPTGVHSPDLVGRCLGDPLERLLESQGWRVVEGISAPRGRKGYSRRPAGAAPAVHEHGEFGPQRREAERRKRFREDCHVVRSILEYTIVQATDDGPRICLTKERLDAAQRELLDSTPAGSGRLGRRLRLLWRYIDSLERGRQLDGIPARITMLRGEPSPFDAIFLRRLRQYQAAVDGFPGVLSRRARPDKERGQRERANRARRSAEVCVTAALHGAVINPDQLQRLAGAIHEGKVLRLGGCVFVDIPRPDDPRPAWRWHPDPLSAGLLLGLESIVLPDRTEDIQNEVTSALRDLLDELGLPAGQDPWKRLALVAGAGARYFLPPYLAARVTAAGDYQPLSTDALVRLLCDRCLAGGTVPGGRVESPPTDSGEVDLPPPPIAVSDCTETAAILRRELLGQVAGALRTVAKGADARAKRLRASLERALLRYLDDQGPRIPPILYLVGVWGIDLARNGTRRKRTLAPRTIQRYLGALTRPMLEEAESIDPISADPVELEAFYERVISHPRSPASQVYVAGRCAEFQAFLSRTFGVEAPDPAVFRGAVIESVADANIVTPSEYSRALDALCVDQAVDDRSRVQQSGLLVLGYRFGLRIGETLRLRPQDLGYLDGRLDSLRVRGSVYGTTKTRNGHRHIPLIGELSPREAEILDTLALWADTVSEEDAQSPLFSATPGSPGRAVLNPIRHLRRLRQALIEVTGDEGMRYHHLRRSFAQRLLASLIGDTGLESWRCICTELAFQGFAAVDIRERLTGRKEFGAASMHGLAMVLGHANVGVTLASYIHILDPLFRVSPGQGPAVHWDDHVLSYILGKKVTAIRKQRSRLNIPAADASRLLTESSWRVGRNLDNKLGAPRGDIQLPFTPEVEWGCTLEDMDRLLCAAARRYDAAYLQRYMGMDEDHVADILKAAIDVERRIGYDYYRLGRQVSRWTGDPHQKAQEIEGAGRISGSAETRRLRRYLRQFGFTIAGLPTELMDAAAAWEVAYRDGAGSGRLRFEARATVSAFLAGLSALGLSAQEFRTSVTLEHSSGGARMITTTGLREACGLADAAAAEIGAEGLVDAALKPGSKGVSYQRTANRVMYLFAVARQWKMRA